MLELPKGDGRFSIMGIDPGTDTLGVSLVEIDIKAETVHLVHAETFHGRKGVSLYKDYSNEFGDRRAKFRYNKEKLVSFLNWAQPNIIISESPYMGRFANAFEALVQCLEMLRATVHNYDPSLQLQTIDPSSVKKAVGAPGKTKKGGQKDLVKQGVMGLTKLINETKWPLDCYDEHTIDAIAVACYQVNQLYKDILKN